MHELSIALSIIDGAEEALLRQGGGSVLSLHLRLGPLSSVSKEALLFSYELASQGTPLEGSRLIIEDVPLRIHCPRCRAERSPISCQSLRCAECGTPASELLHGAEMELYAMQLESVELGNVDLQT